MLTFKMVKPLGGVLKRLDTQAMVEQLKGIDIHDENAAEQVGITIVGMILPKVEDVADDLVKLVAAYKGVSFEEALEMDPLSTLKELFSEPGFSDFFRSAAGLAGRK